MERLLVALEQRGASPWTPILAATCVAGLRMAEEFVFIFVPRNIHRGVMGWVGHITLFYLALILCIAALLRLTTRRNPARLLAITSAGLLLGLLPPLVDAFVYGIGQFNYSYQPHLDAEFPFLLYAPPLAIPVGETIAIWLAVILTTLYAGLTTRSILRTVATALGIYGLVLFFMGILPPAGHYLMNALRAPSINELVSALLFGCSAVALGVLYPGLVRHTIVRLPHLTLPPLLVVVGSALVQRLNVHTLVAAMSMWVAASLFALNNDLYDSADDQAEGRRLAIDRDQVLLWTTLIVPLWISLCEAHFWPMLLSVLFLMISHSYHAPPFRLKALFPMAYLLEALLALLTLAAGILTHDRILLAPQQLAMMMLLAAGVGLIAPLKDAKDFQADRNAGIATWFVVLDRRGWSPRQALGLATTLAGACLLVPVVFLVWRADVPHAAALLVAGGLSLVAFRLLNHLGHATILWMTFLNAYLAIGAAALLGLPA